MDGYIDTSSCCCTKNPDALSRLLQGLQDEVDAKKCKYLKTSEELLDVISSCGIAHTIWKCCSTTNAILSRLDDDGDDDDDEIQRVFKMH